MQTFRRAGTKFIASARTTCNFTNIIKNNLSCISVSISYMIISGCLFSHSRLSLGGWPIVWTQRNMRWIRHASALYYWSRDTEIAREEFHVANFLLGLQQDLLPITLGNTFRLLMRPSPMWDECFAPFYWGRRLFSSGWLNCGLTIHSTDYF